MIRQAEIIRKLRGHYREAWQPALKFFEWCGEKSATPRTTNVDDLRTALKLTTSEVRQLASGINAVGIGKRIVGRRGAKSRIQWLFTLESISRVAKGNADKLVEIAQQSVPSDDYLQEHSYNLRHDEEPVTVKLPRNLTKREAERYAAFILTLPQD